MRSRLNEGRVRKEQIEGEIKVYHEQISAAEMNIKHQENRLSEIETQEEQKQKELASYLEEKKTADEKLEDLNKAQEAANTRSSVSGTF